MRKRYSLPGVLAGNRQFERIGFYAGLVYPSRNSIPKPFNYSLTKVRSFEFHHAPPPRGMRL